MRTGGSQTVQWESCDKEMWRQLLLMMVVDGGACAEGGCGRSRLHRVVVGVSVRWPASTRCREPSAPLIYPARSGSQQ
ncbi:hypothetical protein L208DRAFT_1410256 [Tricholoma matsutake]|nr:hypothetical protein L208DRAFT_1410256 [Tricholoma matsutake 945]